jgi:hypothetical protein
MSVDFKARQIRVNQIINSGSTSTSPLLLYGMNSVTDEVGGYVASHFAATGSDTWLFVSGTIGSKNSSSRGVATFGGDVVISGTIYNSAGASYSVGGGSGVSYFDSTTNGSIFTTGSAAFRGADSIDSPSDKGTDVFFYVSGTSSKVSLFGGSLVSSGSIILKNASDNTSILLNSLAGDLSGSRNLAVGGAISGSSARIYTPDEGSIVLSSSLSFSSISHVSDGNFYLTNNTNSGLMILGATNASSVGKQILKIEASSSRGNIYLSGSTYAGVDSSDKIFVNARLASDIIPDGNRTRNLGSESARFANIYTGDLHLRNERGDWTIVEEPDYLCVVNNKTGKRHKMVLQAID